MRQRSWKQILWIALLAISCSRCAVEQGKVYTRDGKTYGVTSGFTWRGQWWDYYERGTSYASGSFWQDAIPDFQAAIKQRDKDQRQARTYGLHFLDYFPHRELGIVYYQLGRYQEAIHELEMSRQGEDTAKAKFFLNKARRALLQQSQRDNAPPRIRIATPQDGALTNQLAMMVTGQAEDDTSIAALTINGQACFVELAEPRFAFSQNLPLRDGANTIDIVARDLVGGETHQRLTVYLDRHGPLVSISQIQTVDALPQRRVRLEGFITDQSRITRLVMAGQHVNLQADASGAFRTEIDLPAQRTAVAFEAEDAAGNVTRGDIALDPNRLPPGRQGKALFQPWSRWAALPADSLTDIVAGSGALQHMAQAPASASPVIKIRNIEDHEVLYQETLYIEGEIRGASTIQGFAINGEMRPSRMAPQLFFGETIALQEGENQIALEATDALGHKAQYALTVTRATPPTQQLSARLRVSLFPLERKGSPSAISEAVDAQLANTLINQGRFGLVERQHLESILQELKLSQTALIDPKTALEVGKIAAAEGMLLGTVAETSRTHDKPQSLEIYIRLVDVSTTDILAATDIYGEEIASLRDLPRLLEGLAWKLQQEFPVVEGLVLGIQGTKLLTDLAASQSLKRQMPLVIFRPGAEIKHPRTGRILKKPPEIIGEAKLVNISQDTSEATIVSGKLVGEIQESDMVITK